MRKFLLVLLVGLFFIGTAGIGHALTIVDLDSATNDYDNGIEISFEAGSYVVTPIAGSYIAWDAWSTKDEYVNKYSLDSAEFDAYNVWDGIAYDTEEEALENALSTSFTLASAGVVKFFIDDSNYTDNTGGMTLQVTAAPVPEPATILLLGTGLVGLAGASRKKFKK